MKKIIIAIDGYSSCGKSTLAKTLAARLQFRYIDSGAMYRAVTLYLMQNQIAVDDQANIIDALPNIDIDFHLNPTNQKQETYLNGINVEDAIRQMEVSKNVSQVSTIKEVRVFLVAQQQRMGQDKGIIMDGRDIGTHVFPNAELKIFMTADPKVRAQRRLDELYAKGEDVTFDEVFKNLQTRDRIDTTRKESPLVQADDARVLDNTHMNRTQQLELTLQWVKQHQQTASC